MVKSAREEYVDLKSFSVDKTKPQPERLKQFVIDAKNPCKVRVGDVLVQIEFTSGKNFSDALTVAFSA